MLLYNAPSSYYSMIARYALLEAGVPYEHRRMDIHIAKQQLTSWYRLINPKMTVPAMTDGKTTLVDSSDILDYAAAKAGTAWLDSDPEIALQIQQLVYAHYTIAIERLTFAKVMTHCAPARYLFLTMLRRIIKKLEAELQSSANNDAVAAKITLNEQRLAFFTEGNLVEKLDLERNSVRNYLKKLPAPQQFLFGDKPSSADIVSVVLCARIEMIGEDDLVSSIELMDWFSRMQGREAYKKADIWTTFKPWRILLRY